MTMIQRIENLFRRWRLIAPFDEDDVINAEIEDAARTQQKVIERLQSSLSNRTAINEKLGEAIRIAKRKTNSFEQFEKLIVGRKHD